MPSNGRVLLLERSRNKQSYEERDSWDCLAMPSVSSSSGSSPVIFRDMCPVGVSWKRGPFLRGKVDPGGMTFSFGHSWGHQDYLKGPHSF